MICSVFLSSFVRFLPSLHSLDGGVRACVVHPSSDRWQQCECEAPQQCAKRPIQAYSVDGTTTLNDRCVREACSFDGKLVDDTLFAIRQTTERVHIRLTDNIIIKSCTINTFISPLIVHCYSFSQHIINILSLITTHTRYRHSC